MSNDPNAIIALLSNDEVLDTEQIKQLQQNLAEQGFNKNAERYPNPDGVIGTLTRTDIINFISDNPESLLTISATMVQSLSNEGLGDRLQAIVENNQSVRDALVAQAKDILDGRNVNTMHGTSELKDFQTKLKLLGEYDARIDGFTGRESRKAAESVREQFTLASSPRPVARPQQQVEIISDPDSQTTEKQVDNENVTQSEHLPQQIIGAAYMQALEFDERGLQIGDGGERNWNDKRDPQVWNLQVLLNRTGADIAIDGDYGGGTARAVRNFQQEHDLPVTGQADFETLKILTSLPETQFSVTAQDDPKMYTIIEQHRIIENISNQVKTDTGVSSGYLRAVRGMETHYGTDMKSDTGSQGPYQFTSSTFRSIINQYGDEIAQDLRGIGQDALADKVLQSQAGAVDGSLRYDPYISTYAAAFLTKENGINTLDQNNWGRAYAAHNIGRGGLNTVLNNLNTSNVGGVLDRKYDPDPARNNPYFFRGGANGQTVLNRYQHEMETWHGRYDERVEPLLESVREMQIAQATAQSISAQSIATPTIMVGKPF